VRVYFSKFSHLLLFLFVLALLGFSFEQKMFKLHFLVLEQALPDAADDSFFWLSNFKKDREITWYS